MPRLKSLGWVPMPASSNPVLLSPKAQMLRYPKSNFRFLFTQSGHQFVDHNQPEFAKEGREKEGRRKGGRKEGEERKEGRG
jgi:hypothetical protein